MFFFELANTCVCTFVRVFFKSPKAGYTLSQARTKGGGGQGRPPPPLTLVKFSYHSRKDDKSPLAISKINYKFHTFAW